MKKLLIFGFLAMVCMGIQAQTDDYQYMNIVSSDNTRAVQLSRVKKITFSEENAIVTVTDADALEMPLTSLKKFSFSVSVNADVNCDSSVNISDVNAVLSVMFGSSEHESEADVNGDGAVNISDVNSVLGAMFGD